MNASLGQNFAGYNNFNSQGVQFRPHQDMENDDDSGVCSPPLWKNSPSPPKSPSYPLLHHHNNYRSLSPNSRTQAIARGQWELMEMVKNMPETSYELSLKDLVEHPRIEANTRDHDQEERAKMKGNQGSSILHRRGQVRRQESKKNEHMMRSGSFDNRGLFLKMVFPLSFKSKKKKDLATNSTNGKVSPKPEGSSKGSGNAEKDWWKKRFTGSTDSDSSRTTTNSGSSGSTGSTGSSASGRSYSRRKRNGFLTSCWSCFHSRRGKS